MGDGPGLGSLERWGQGPDMEEAAQNSSVGNNLNETKRKETVEMNIITIVLMLVSLFSQSKYSDDRYVSYGCDNTNADVTRGTNTA